MFPRSGGEKVYLEAVYRRPKYLATVVFAANAIILGFTAGNCIVSPSFPSSCVGCHVITVGLCRKVGMNDLCKR